MSSCCVHAAYAEVFKVFNLNDNEHSGGQTCKLPLQNRGLERYLDSLALFHRFGRLQQLAGAETRHAGDQ